MKMIKKIPFDGTPYGRMFLEVTRLLYGDYQYGNIDTVWLAALAIFAQAKLDHEMGEDKNITVSSSEYWARLNSLFECGDSISVQLPIPARPSIFEEAFNIVVDLVRIHGCEDWDFSDSYWYLSRTSYGMPSVISPEVADLMVEVFGDVKEKNVWCLFDGSYQLACRFAKKRAHVVVTLDNEIVRNALTLLNRLHGTTIKYDSPITVQNDNQIPFDLGVAVPPFGVRGLPRAYATSTFDEVDKWPGQQNRLELFAIRTLWERVAGQCAILVPPNVLFSTGQEQRFREFLVFDLNAVEAVISLPARQISSTNLAVGVLVLNHQANFQTIRFVDASVSAGIEKKGRADIRIKSGEIIASLARRAKDDPIFAKDIKRKELPASDTSLHPPRYISSVTLAGKTIRLGDIVEALIRPPARPVGHDQADAKEINISNLHEWGYVNETEKQVAVRKTKLQVSRLRDDDIIFSIKGSLGKVGIFQLVHKDQTDNPYVVSQSCIALRLSSEGLKKISPIALYMYLRSATGKAAINALNVGAAIPHIQPAALLDQLEVPVMSMKQQENLTEVFQNLWKLQQDIYKKQQEMDAIADTYWQNYSN